MKSLTAREIKKKLIGIVASDGHIDLKNSRFEFYTKSKELSDDVTNTLNNITGMHVNYSYDKKNNGHRIFTRKHVYFKYLGEKFYFNRKQLIPYTVNRMNEQSFAYIWMCDGYLEHSKNRKTNKVQNIGWFCLEAFPKEELELIQARLDTWGINSSLVKKPWGFGYRIRIGGENLQKFISMVYPYILSDFLYKTILFYKGKEYVLDLPSAEHFINYYNEVDDIVRHPLKKGKT